MKTLASLIVLALTLSLASVDADAARRFGGGGNTGKQRPAPTMREATPQQAPAQAAKPAQQPAPSTATTPPPVQPKPSFMSRFGGLLAGLGIGALLGSLFGGHLGGAGSFLMLLLIGAVLFMIVRAFMRRGGGGSRFEPAAAGGPAMREAETASRPVFSGIGSGIPTGDAAAPAPRTFEPELSAPLPADFDREAFLRVAKTSFIRLQAANDAKDLDDIRDYTTPEMYAEISMQLAERGAEPQRTEVVSLEAQLYDYAIDGDSEIASVRFHGLIREAPGAAAEPFDEVWHVRKKRGEARAPWLIAGIQQA